MSHNEVSIHVKWYSRDQPFIIGVKYAEEKIEAKARELKETKNLVEDQAQEIGQLRVQLAETKVVKPYFTFLTLNS